MSRRTRRWTPSSLYHRGGDVETLSRPQTTAQEDPVETQQLRDEATIISNEILLLPSLLRLVDSSSSAALASRPSSSKAGSRPASSCGELQFHPLTKPVTPPMPPALPTGLSFTPPDLAAAVAANDVEVRESGGASLEVVGSRTLNRRPDTLVNNARSSIIETEAPPLFYGKGLDNVPAFTICDTPEFVVEEKDDGDDESGTEGRLWWLGSEGSESVVDGSWNDYDSNELVSDDQETQSSRPSEVAAHRVEELIGRSFAGTRTRLECEEIAQHLLLHNPAMSHLGTPTVRRFAQQLRLRHVSSSCYPCLLFGATDESLDAIIFVRAVVPVDTSRSDGEGDPIQTPIQTFRPAPPAYRAYPIPRAEMVEISVAGRKAITVDLDDDIARLDGEDLKPDRCWWRGRASSEDASEVLVEEEEEDLHRTQEPRQHLGRHYRYQSVRPLELLLNLNTLPSSHDSEGSTPSKRRGVIAILHSPCILAILPAPHHDLLHQSETPRGRVERCLAAMEAAEPRRFPFVLLLERQRRWLSAQAEVRCFEPGARVTTARRTIRLLYIVESGLLSTTPPHDHPPELIPGRGALLGFQDLLNGDDVFSADAYAAGSRPVVMFVLRRSSVEQVILHSAPLRKALLGGGIIPGQAPPAATITNSLPRLAASTTTPSQPSPKSRSSATTTDSSSHSSSSSLFSSSTNSSVSYGKLVVDSLKSRKKGKKKQGVPKHKPGAAAAAAAAGWGWDLRRPRYIPRTAGSLGSISHLNFE